ncbi:zinc finger protein AEBP2-like, partial [Nilaparvata lugens]|uniref:zinc finger protein AEBP2-like n=1 Tax=Nilaparvata lugens TaxID=108931 RepID=UPI00193DFC32
YWAVTNVDYIHTRNGSRIVTMIVVVWFLRSSRNKSDNQQASLALVEGQSSTEVLAEEEAQISSEDQVTGAGGGGGGGGGGEGEVAVTTAFTISSPSTDTNHRVKEEDEETGKEVNENQVTNNNSSVTSASLSSATYPHHR